MSPARRPVAFLIPTRIAAYSAIPMLEESLRRPELATQVIASRQVLEELEGVLDLSDATLLDLAVFDATAPRLRRANGLLTWLLTSRQFSPAYGMRLDTQQEGRAARRAAVARAVERVGFRSGQRVNRALDRAFAFERNHFPTDTIVLITPGAANHLLHARHLTVVALMESWDHPAKKPVGLEVDALMPWNADLADDWAGHQGPTRILPGYPFKLRGLVQPVHGVREGPTRRVLYAATASALTPHGTVFEEEQAMVAAILPALRARDVDVRIKPKPASGADDFQEFAGPHVEVLSEAGAVSPTDYFLSDDYNRQRLDQLRSVDCVISAGTTFALDAATAGRPVVQIDCRAARGRLPMLARGSQNEHLTAHILCHDDLTVKVDDDLEASAERVAAAVADLTAARELTDRLRRWLGVEADIGAACRDALDAILALPRR